MTTIQDIPELDPSGLRNFALSTGAIVIVLFAVVIPWLFGFAYPLWPWVLSGVLVVPGLVAPAVLRPVYRTWMRFGLLMSRVTTPLVLGLVYYLVITPMAVLMRSRGRDPLARKLDPNARTYRVLAKRNSLENMERPY